MERLHDGIQPLAGIPGAYYSSEPVRVVACETVMDAYTAFMDAYHEELIDIVYYEDWSERQLAGINEMVKAEYGQPDISSDYKHFLENKFPLLNRR